MELRWKIILGVGGIMMVLAIAITSVWWLGKRNQLELLGNDTSVSDPVILAEASVQNQIEESGKRHSPAE